LNPQLLGQITIYLIAPFAVGAIALLVGQRHVRTEAEVTNGPRNPLRVIEALQMAAVFQAVLFAFDYVRRFGGDVGVIASGAALGLTDMDALTLSMARGASSGVPLDVAGRAIAVGLISNTVLKLGLAITLGRQRFRGVVALSLGAMALSVAAALILV
jgi:uncharacterized membrane protein (DUF4010 family)